MSTDQFRRNSDNYCYRHGDRQSFVLCQRCLRTICPDCQTQAAVGVICPECMADQRRQRTPAQKKAQRRWGARPASVALSDARPVVTYGIIAATVLVFIATLIPGVGPQIQGALAFNSIFVWPDAPTGLQPWRLLTVMLVHDGFLHVGLNMLALWAIGRILEPLFGRVRFLVLYVLSGLGGSVAVALLDPLGWVVGASGGIFGLFGALLIVGRHLGANIRGIAILIALNFALPFVFAVTGAIGTGSLAQALSEMRVSWQGHLGGLIAGVVVGLIYAGTRRMSRRPLQVALLIGLAVVLVALLALPPLIYG